MELSKASTKYIKEASLREKEKTHKKYVKIKVNNNSESEKSSNRPLK